MFPYDLVGSKTLRPVAGSPIMLHMVRALRAFTAAPIHIVTLRRYYGAVSTCFEGIERSGDPWNGTLGRAARSPAGGYGASIRGDAMVALWRHVGGLEDLRRLYQDAGYPRSPCAFPWELSAMDWICAQVEGGLVRAIGAHHRGSAYPPAGGLCPAQGLYPPAGVDTGVFFPGMKVGEGRTLERYGSAAPVQAPAAWLR